MQIRDTAPVKTNSSELISSFDKVGNITSTRVKPQFFETFNIFIRHIFPEKFIELPQVVQMI